MRRTQLAKFKKMIKHEYGIDTEREEGIIPRRTDISKQNKTQQVTGTLKILVCQKNDIMSCPYSINSN